MWGVLQADLFSEKWEFYCRDYAAEGDTYEGLFYTLLESKIEIVFVNNLNAFNCKITKYFSPDEDEKTFFVSYNSRDKEYKHYFITYEGIEFRNLDIYIKEPMTPEKSYKFLDTACTIFKNKRKLSIRHNFKYGLNATLIKTGSKKDYNNADFVPRICNSNFLIPSENDLDMLLKIYKGSFSGVNHINEVFHYVYSADIKSSHTAFSVYETFPANRVNVDFSSAMNDTNYHWIAIFKFDKLEKNPDFIFDLSSMVDSNTVILTDIDFHGWFKRCFNCKSFQILKYQVYTKRRLPQNLIQEILKAYKLKEQYKHTPYGGYFKLITEQLSFGSSIKAPDFGYNVELINRNFTPVKTKPKTNQELITALAKRPLSYYQGTWIAAYSRSKIITEVLRHGCKSVLHFDTDGIDFIDVLPYKGTQLGEFIQKPTYSSFKVIGDKQYVGLCGEERVIKVAGLKESNIPADYDIMKLNKNNISDFMPQYYLDYKNHTVVKIR